MNYNYLGFLMNFLIKKAAHCVEKYGRIFNQTN